MGEEVEPAVEGLAVVKFPDPVLRTRARPVHAVTDDTRALIEAMVETMHRAQGVGLAAPQVGHSVRIMMANERAERGRDRVFINPEILEHRGTMVGPEGCLSVPGLFGEVKRWAWVRACALNERGEPFEVEAEGLLARIIQHEVDHLNGLLFFDRLGYVKRRQILRKLRQGVALR